MGRRWATRSQDGIGPRVAFEYPISDEPAFTARQIRDAVPSPDGSRLAFTALDRLYVMDYPDGTPQAVTDADSMSEAQPVWSPDGEWLAYVTWSDAEGGNIYKVKPNGRDAQRVTTVPAIYQQVVWAPNGQRIVAIRGPAHAFEESTGPRASGVIDDLIWVSAEGGAPQTIVPAEGRSNPHFVAASERIYLFHGTNGLVSIRWDGTDQKEHVKVTGNKRPGAKQPNRASLITMAPVGDRALATVNNDVYVVTVPYVGGDTPTISVSNPDPLGEHITAHSRLDRSPPLIK